MDEIIPAVLAGGVNPATGEYERFVRRGETVYLVPGREPITASALDRSRHTWSFTMWEFRWGFNEWPWAQGRP